MSFIENFNYNRDGLVGQPIPNPDHGYSLFNLNQNPDQYVVDVVDVGTNTTGSYTAKDLDDGTLLAAVGAVGVVSKLYDQFGGKHAYAYLDNTGIMPYIITGGEFVTLDGLPAMIFRSGSRNAYLNIKTKGFDSAEPADLSTHILGVNGIESFVTASLDENATNNSNAYNNSYIFGENYNSAKKDYGFGFYLDGSDNRLTLYVERGSNNNFIRGSVAGDTDATQHGYAYTGEIVTLGQRYTINTFANFDEVAGNGVVGFGTGQNYTSGTVVTGRDNYVVGSIGSDQTYDQTFKGKLQEVLFYTSLRSDRAAIYSDIQERLSGLVNDPGFSPSYGSSITFTANNSQWYGSSYYNFIVPNGLNSIKAEMDFKFQGNKQKIQKLLKRVQKATSGPITRDSAFSGLGSFINFGQYVTPTKINLDTDYYKDFEGSQITNYNVQHVASDVYELNLSLFNDRVSPVLNNGMGFVADKTVDIVGSSFEEFDVAKFRDLALFDNDAGIDAYVHYGSDIISISNELDISFSVILTGYNTPGDSISGAHFFSQHDSSSSRIFYYHDLDNIRFKTNSTDASFGDTQDIILELNRKYDIKFTRDSSDNLSLFIDGSQIESSQSVPGNFIFGRIGGPWDASTNVPPLNGTIFDISVKSGSNLTEVFKVVGNGTGVDDWSSDINGYDFDATIVGSLENYELAKNSEIFNNYFYLTGSRSSSITTSNVTGLVTYTGFAEDATRTFFWEPDLQTNLSFDHSNRVNELKGSFTQSLNLSNNQNYIKQIDLTFSNRTQKETYAILHFLESHLGYKQFVYEYDDDIINQKRIFYCPQWKHTFNYKDSNTLQARFVEIPNPVTPQF